MKYKVLVFLITVLFLSCKTDKNKMDDLILNNNFSFWLVNKNGSYGGSVRNDHDLWSCNFGSDYVYFGFDSREILEDKVIVSYLSGNFILRGSPAYREYEYPKKYSFPITKEQIENRLESLKKRKIQENNEIIKNTTISVSECHGISISDNVRIREKPSLNKDVKTIGKLNKFQKITLTECGAIATIDTLQAPWYKVRLEDGTEGWVFGGYAKIYFSDEDLQMLYKAFEKEGSEYTNQFITPDNS